MLYEATMHSYSLMYEDGRERLKKEKEPRIKFKRGDKEVPRLLRVVTYHARDVYPELLRSTMLIRLVAAYEAYLVDCVEEVSRRSKKPFFTDGRVDFSHEQLLTIDGTEGIYRHLVKKTLRKLTSGGLKEIRKFYQKQLGTDLVAEPRLIEPIEEIHDRRHLFVHRAGYADGEYINKHPTIGVAEDSLLKVTDKYFLDALAALGASALYIKKAIEALFPAPNIRSYLSGDVSLPSTPDNLNFISFNLLKPEGGAGIVDLTLALDDESSLKSITVWLSNDGGEVRMLVGGGDRELKKLREELRSRTKIGTIEMSDSFKIKR